MHDDKEFVISASEAESETKKASFFKSRGFKYGSLATALTAVLIVVVIAANIVFSILTDTYSWALDFTSTNLYDISDATKQVVNALPKQTQIKITVFYDESTYPHYFAEPIKRFANLSENITYEYIDPEKNPASLNQYGTEYQVGSGAVVVESGDRVRVFNTDDYFEYDNETGATAIYIEERLAAGTLYVTKEDIPVVYFVSGHGEAGYESLMNLIANNGADVREVNLMTDKLEFSPYSKLMVICNPARDYSETEIRMLEDFVNNENKFGRNIMYFSSADAIELPNLEAMMETWGIRFNDDLVLDSKNSWVNYPYILAPEFTKEDIMNTGTAVSTVTAPIVSYSRSIDLLFEENSMYRTQKLISSIADTSYARGINEVSTTWDKQATDKNGPHNLAALSMKYKYENNIQVQSYLFAAGSTDMLSYLTYSGNGEFLMQLYKIMVNEQDETIVAAQKSTSSTVAAFTSAESNIMTVVVLIVVPLIFLIIGLVVYIRRRFL